MRIMFVMGVLLMASGIFLVAKKGPERIIGVFLIIAGIYTAFTFRKISIG